METKAKATQARRAISDLLAEGYPRSRLAARDRELLYMVCEIVGDLENRLLAERSQWYACLVAGEAQ